MWEGGKRLTKLLIQNKIKQKITICFQIFFGAWLFQKNRFLWNQRKHSFFFFTYVQICLNKDIYNFELYVQQKGSKEEQRQNKFIKKRRRQVGWPGGWGCEGGGGRETFKLESKAAATAFFFSLLKDGKAVFLSVQIMHNQSPFCLHRN